MAAEEGAAAASTTLDSGFNTYLEIPHADLTFEKCVGCALPLCASTASANADAAGEGEGAAASSRSFLLVSARSPSFFSLSLLPFCLCFAVYCLVWVTAHSVF